MAKTKQEFIDFFTHMSNEEQYDGPLGGMAWDEVTWYYWEAVNNKVFSEEELTKMFPILFGE